MNVICIVALVLVRLHSLLALASRYSLLIYIYIFLTSIVTYYSIYDDTRISYGDLQEGEHWFGLSL